MSGEAAAFDYLRDPAAIYRRSFALVREATRLDGIAEEDAELVLRLVHACAMPEIVPDIVIDGPVLRDGRAALAAGAPVLVDCEMLAAGVIRRLLPAGNPVLCTLNDEGVAEDALVRGTTRSAAAIDRWLPRLDGAVVAIGNAPTALFRLLELLREGAPRPAAIMAFPVGFVGAAESKQALIGESLGIPFAALRGRRGGSAMAAAAVNALGAGAEA
tara:strand:- start:262 stop:909 length:648 start_codon:yes stop_codon:yes gene_type:complete